jgi:hypothetical protein
LVYGEAVSGGNLCIRYASYESGDNTSAAVAKLLAENVVFHSPLLVRTVEGREKVSVILATSPKIRHGAYTAEYRLDNRNTFLRWKGKIEGHEIESLGVLTDNDLGLVVEYIIAFRPLPAAQIFRDVLYPLIKDIVGPEYWECSTSAP